MGANKLVVAGVVKLDLTGDTLAADKLLSGYTGHAASGEAVTGTLVVQTYRTGSGAPSSDLGANGDLYLDLG